MKTADGLTAEDEGFLRRAIDLAALSLDDPSLTPFGAVVALDGEVVGEGLSQVVKKADPTAHAEVEALRAAGANLGNHIMESATMYASGEPCPMCLIACYWAQIPRVVFGATTHDIALLGFEDLQFYRELALPRGERTLIQEVEVGGPLGLAARNVLEGWVENLPFPVTPKL